MFPKREDADTERAARGKQRVWAQEIGPTFREKRAWGHKVSRCDGIAKRPERESEYASLCVGVDIVTS